MMEKERKQNIWLLKRAALFLAKDSPGILPLAVLVAALEAAYPYIGILLSARILDGLTGATVEPAYLFFLAALLVCLNFFGSLLLSALGQLLDVLQYKELKHIEHSIAQKAWNLDYEILSRPEVNARRRELANWHYDTGVLAIVGYTKNILSALITIGISLVLTAEMFAARTGGESFLGTFFNHWSAPVVFVLLFGAMVAGNLRGSAKLQKKRIEMSEKYEVPLNCSSELLYRGVTDYHPGKDIRLYQGEKVIHDRLADYYDQCLKIDTDVMKAESRTGIAGTLRAWIFSLAVYLYVAMKAVCGAFGAGSVLKYAGMVLQFGQGAESLFQQVRGLIQNTAYIEKYFNFLDMAGRRDAGGEEIARELLQDYRIEFRGVSFAYPGSSGPALKDINCVIKSGEKLAVVGRNGSGKTTFIKLLCRLYDPGEGQILLNGKDIREYRYEEYLDLFAAVFQDVELYAFTLGENIACQNHYEEQKVLRVLEEAGLSEFLKELPQGLDTPVTSYFEENGVELSGGEKQKAAIARCLYKDAPYVILDEPTAALDPRAEANIYSSLNQTVSHKGALYISHRLSSCRFCDRILVFDEGNLIEEGTHEELLKLGGAYSRLWDAQARYYQADEALVR